MLHGADYQSKDSHCIHCLTVVTYFSLHKTAKIRTGDVFRNSVWLFFTPYILGSGTIDFNEFCQMMNKKQEEDCDHEEEMKQAFCVFDKDGRWVCSQSDQKPVSTIERSRL